MIETIKTCDRCGAKQQSGKASKTEVRSVIILGPVGSLTADTDFELCVECIAVVARAAREAIRKSAIDKTVLI